MRQPLACLAVFALSACAAPAPRIDAPGPAPAALVTGYGGGDVPVYFAASPGIAGPEAIDLVVETGREGDVVKTATGPRIAYGNSAGRLRRVRLNDAEFAVIDGLSTPYVAPEVVAAERDDLVARGVSRTGCRKAGPVVTRYANGVPLAYVAPIDC